MRLAVDYTVIAVRKIGSIGKKIASRRNRRDAYVCEKRPRHISIIRGTADVHHTHTSLRMRSTAPWLSGLTGSNNQSIDFDCKKVFQFVLTELRWEDAKFDVERIRTSAPEGI